MWSFDGLYHLIKQLLIKKYKKAIFAHSPQGTLDDWLQKSSTPPGSSASAWLWRECAERQSRETSERTVSVWHWDRQKYKSLLIPVHGNRTQLIIFSEILIITEIKHSKTRLSLGYIAKIQVLCFISYCALFKEALTLLSTCAISKVPVVSMLAAMIGMPLYVCFEFRNVKVLCRSTFKNETCEGNYFPNIQQYSTCDSLKSLILMDRLIINSNILCSCPILLSLKPIQTALKYITTKIQIYLDPFSWHISTITTEREAFSMSSRY